MSLDVQMVTVGPVAENCFVLRREGSGSGVLIVDPGDEPDRSSPRSRKSGAKIDAILITHCHFDHIGACQPVAAATGAPVYCPQLEAPVLADIMADRPGAGYRPLRELRAQTSCSAAARPSSSPA